MRNELTQKAVARECAAWIRKKAKFKSTCTSETTAGFFNICAKDQVYTYLPFNGFTTVDLGCERGNSLCNYVNRFESPCSEEYLRAFNKLWDDKTRMQDVTEEVIECISAVYQENPAELIYFLTLYNVFREFLEDLSDDMMPNEATGFKESAIWNKLYAFQKDAALGIINKLEQYNGCILADSVGLGKTFTALAVIKYYEGKNKNILVLCPKKLGDNWQTYRLNLIDNPLLADRLRYDVVYHTDLMRKKGHSSSGIPFDRFNWGNYDLIVIDESHNFRNGGGFIGENQERENRYSTLMNQVLRAGVKTKVLMLSATPVNNRLDDLRQQLKFIYEGDAAQINDKLNTSVGIDSIFREAQKAFNDWSRLPAELQKTQTLLDHLDYNFFELLDSVTIARSRKHIQKYYDMSEIGTFPKRLPPLTFRPKLTDLPEAVNYREIYDSLLSLKLTLYVPSHYILQSRRSTYENGDEEHRGNLSVAGREEGIRRLMSTNLLKRLESSVHSFRRTLERIDQNLGNKIAQIEAFQRGVTTSDSSPANPLDESDFDWDDQNTDLFSVGNKAKIALADMDYLTWLRELREDKEMIDLLLAMVNDITPEHDNKLAQLRAVIDAKISHPLTPGNQKIIIFTAFSDTAEYLYDQISRFVYEKYGLHTAMITGQNNRTTLKNFSNRDMNRILTIFSPISKGKSAIMPNDHQRLDLLIATDCISEGQNLQDCDYLINYDIHWNPVRIIQRFGRIDRIGSRNEKIQLVIFWPDIKLDEYIQLKSRVEKRMKMSAITASGEKNVLLPNDEEDDLPYRRQQLERLQKEVVDLEEMTNSFSITDLGLNDFRMDLASYLKEHPDMDRLPFGIHAVVHGERSGVLFVLKNINQSIKKESQNKIHPFYIVFVGEDGSVLCDHLQPKLILDQMRHLARGAKTPDLSACRIFNEATEDGKNMSRVSELLRCAIASMVRGKEQKDIDSFFSRAGTTSFLDRSFSGLDDFELITFLVVVKE